MKLLIFTEGTIIMHGQAANVSREERVKQSQAVGIQREERQIVYDTDIEPTQAKPGTPYDLVSYVPIGDAVNKIKKWQDQQAEIQYLTSRRIKGEIEMIESILNKYRFPKSKIHFRKTGEDYKDVAERVMPTALIEDDCESIGGEKEMTYTYIRDNLKSKIKSIPVPEFGGIDHLPDNVDELLTYQSL